MDNAAGPYRFDVGVIALAHTDAPVRDATLDDIRAGITGEIDAVVPYPVVLGAHSVLTTYCGRSNAEASRLLGNFSNAGRIRWRDEASRELVRGGLKLARTVGVDGWDGYYAAVARTEGVSTVVTIDDDFERFDAFDTEVVLSSEQLRGLNRYLER
jgi:predicted nucleic acid-binding protein